jgi:hypothetical protein
MLEKVAEESAHEPIAALILELTYANVCPVCREKQVLAGPLTEAERLAPPKKVSAWDDPDEPALAVPAPQPVKTKPKAKPVEIIPDNNLAAAREKQRQRPIVRRA